MMKELKTQNYKFFSHRDCEFFPCHDVADDQNFNCLFCYCPLYVLGEDCGGNFKYTDNGVKDCSGCGIPHSKGGYDYIMEHFKTVIEMVKKEPVEG